LLSIGQHAAHFRFQGTFQEKDVIWNVRLHALPVSGTRKQTMKIKMADSSKTVSAELYLAIETVNEAAIRKSIIMLRNYKNLKTGIHEWTG